MGCFTFCLHEHPHKLFDKFDSKLPLSLLKRVLCRLWIWPELIYGTLVLSILVVAFLEKYDGLCCLDPFVPNAPFFYPLKHQKTLRFSNVFRM